MINLENSWVERVVENDVDGTKSLVRNATYLLKVYCPGCENT